MYITLKSPGAVFRALGCGLVLVSGMAGTARPQAQSKTAPATALLEKAMVRFAKVRSFRDTAALSELASCPDLKKLIDNGYLTLLPPEFFRQVPGATDAVHRDSVRAFAIRTYGDSSPELVMAIRRALPSTNCLSPIAEYFMLPPKGVTVLSYDFQLASQSSETARFYLTERWETAQGVTTKRFVVFWRFATTTRRWWVTAVE